MDIIVIRDCKKIAFFVNIQLDVYFYDWLSRGLGPIKMYIVKPKMIVSAR